MSDTEAQYRSFFENANDACAAWTLEGIITLVNGAAEHLLGWSRDELQGQHYRTVTTPATAALAEERTQRFLAGEDLPSIFAAELVRKDGRAVPVEARTRPIYNTQGTLRGFQGIFRDITERQAAEARQRASEERYRLINELISDYAFSLRLEPDGRLVLEWLTENFTTVSGYTVEELMEHPDPLQVYIHPDDLDRVLHTVRTLTPGVPTTYDFRLVAKDGTTRWMHSRTRAVADTRGQVVRLYGAARDITAQTQAEEARRLSEAKYQTIFALNPDLLYLTDTAGNLLDANTALLDVTGMSLEELRQKNVFAFLASDNRQEVEQALADLRAGGAITGLEVQSPTARGEVRDYWVKALPLPDGQTVLSLARDITAWKQTEAALRDSRERYRTLVDSVKDVIYTLSEDGTVGTLNAAFETITDWSVAEWEGQSFAPLVHPEDLALALDMFQRALQGETTPVFELRIRTRSGDYRIGEFYGRALTQGEKKFVLGISRDITARRQAELEREAAEKKLRESEQLRLQVADTMPDILYVYDLASGGLVYVNRQVATLGYTAEELRGKKGLWLRELLHPDDVLAFSDRHAQLRAAGSTELPDVEYRIRHTNGEWRWFADRAAVFQRAPDGSPVQILGVAQDITDRKRLEKLLQQREVQPREMAERLRKFRESLGKTQDEFGQEFGKYNSRQISSYETGAVAIPMELVVAICAKGFPLEVVFGTAPTALIEKTTTYFSVNYADRIVTRKVLESVVRLMKKDEALMARALRELDLSPRGMLTEQKKLLDMLGAKADEDE